MSITDLLLRHADRMPDRVALEYQGRETTWSQLLDRTRATAGALGEAGVKPGDVVGVLLHNSDRFIEVMHAISHAGAIFMPLNWRLAGPELSYIIGHAGTALLVTEPELEPQLESVRDELDCRTVLVDDVTAGGAAPLLDAFPVDRFDVHRLMYTSGTTSRPKGVMITYDNLWSKDIAQMIEFGMTPDKIGLACGPLYHVGALDITTTTLMYAGATNHIVRRFGVAEVLEAIQRHRVTDVWLAPVMVNQILNSPELARYDTSSVRLLIDGGEKMPLPLIERVLAAFPNAWFADAYGLTETVGGDTILDKGKTKEKLGSVGKAVMHASIKIGDEQGDECPPGEPGEVLIRGPKVCKGYWRDEEATASAIRDGWLHTGDLGVLDEDGYLFILDRLKDVIISGGENIASSEVERAIYEHEAVIEAAVVGRPDEKWIEVPVAYVVLREGADLESVALDEHCRARLARFKVPKEFITIDALPRNPSGKVLKRELRDREQLAVSPEAGDTNVPRYRL
jgi:fatty-acyl-CoA synthase